MTTSQQAEIERLKIDRDEWKDATIAANENQRRSDNKAAAMQEERDELRARLTALEGQEAVAFISPEDLQASRGNYEMTVKLSCHAEAHIGRDVPLYRAVGARPHYEEQPDGSVIPVDPSEIRAQPASAAVPEGVTAWRYDDHEWRKIDGHWDLHYLPQDNGVSIRRAHMHEARMLDAIRPPASAAVPEGWILVPIEPTEAMIEELYGRYISPMAHKSRLTGWRGALQVTPPPPASAKPLPLTDEQINSLYQESTGQSLRPQDYRLAREFARAIEAAHGITGEPT